jgi:phosphoribosyl 1,2-cyclic phosphodiesterase
LLDLTGKQTDNLKVSVLASSSSGNVTYIETPQRHLLVDAGLSGKKIANLMKSINRDLNDVDDLLVTHEHSDHCRGVGVLARRYHLNVYANQPTWKAMAKKIGKVPADQCHIFEMGSTKTLGDLDVESFGVSHDAAAAQFYHLHYNGHSFVVLTDTGYVSNRVEGVIKDADGYLIECNHDPEMLQMGAYPWSLKRRILSDTGHLSNEDGAETMIDVLGNRTKKIYLGHLSQDNNIKELAHLTVASIMKEHDLAVDHDFQLFDTDPEKATKLTVI